MLLRQMEYLAALARERHFTRAADACHVSQPSLSAAIRNLERELDVPIVRRGRRFEGFTPEGERVVMWAHRILAECDALRDELNSMRAGLSGQLRIGAIPTALTVSSLLTTPFCTAHPLAQVSLESLSSRDILHKLHEFELDVGVTYLDGEPLGNVRSVPLYRERYLLLTPVDSEFANRAEVTWPQVAQTALCLLSPAMQNRRLLDKIFAEHEAEARPSLEADTVSALYAHVGSRRWSTVISHAWLYLFGVPDGLKIVPIERPRRAPRIGLVLADRDPEPMLARALVEIAEHADLRSTLDRLLRRYLHP